MLWLDFPVSWHWLDTIWHHTIQHHLAPFDTGIYFNIILKKKFKKNFFFKFFFQIFFKVREIGTKNGFLFWQYQKKTTYYIIFTPKKIPPPKIKEKGIKNPLKKWVRVTARVRSQEQAQNDARARVRITPKNHERGCSLSKGAKKARHSGLKIEEEKNAKERNKSCEIKSI